MFGVFIQMILHLAGLVLSVFDFSLLNELTGNLPDVIIPRALIIGLYFIDPMVIVSLIRMQIAWIGFKIIWAIILRVKSFLPLWGAP